MYKFDRALELLDLKEWLEDYAELICANDSEIRLRQCPICGKDEFKLYVNVEKRIFNCYHCTWGKGIGDICVLMADISGRHINDIKLELANSIVPSLPDDEYVERISELFNKKTKEKAFEIEPILLPGNTEFKGITGKKILKYAKDKRGLTEELINNFELRFSIKLRKFKGFFLVFPVYFKGMPVGWQGRRTTNTEPRYVSSDNIGQWLWPFDQQLPIIKETKSVILVEGVFDALAFWQLGLPSLCTFGKKINNNQKKLLKKEGVKKIYLAWDPDAWKETQKAVKDLSDLFEVFVIILPQDGNKKLDPGNALENENLNEWLIDGVENAVSVESDQYHVWKLSMRFQ